MVPGTLGQRSREKRSLRYHGYSMLPLKAFGQFMSFKRDCCIILPSGAPFIMSLEHNTLLWMDCFFLGVEPGQESGK